MPNVLFYVNPPPKLPFKQVLLLTYFDAIGSWTQEKNEDGDIQLSTDGVLLTSGANPAAQADLHKESKYNAYDLTWDRKRILRLTPCIAPENPDYSYWQIGIGPGYSNPGLYFVYSNGHLYAIAADETDQTQVDTFLTPLFFPSGQPLHIEHNPGSHAEFWLGNNLVASIQTHLPTDPQSARTMASIFTRPVIEDSTSHPTAITIGHLEFYQES